jgi:DNA polymerase-4
VVCTPGEERGFLAPLPLDRIWGVGPKTAEVLRGLGLETMGDVARRGEAALVERLGEVGRHAWRLASGFDERSVEPERERKSIGSERTVDLDLHGKAEVRRALLPLIDEVARALRGKNMRTTGVRLKLKYADFRSLTREVRLPEPACDASSLLHAIDLLLERADCERAIRLVGVAACQLVDETAPRQQSLFAEPQEKSEKIGRVLDAIDKKFGKGMTHRGEAGGRDSKDTEKARK